MSTVLQVVSQDGRKMLSQKKSITPSSLAAIGYQLAICAAAVDQLLNWIRK
jgi:hypothetical protein